MTRISILLLVSTFAFGCSKKDGDSSATKTGEAKGGALTKLGKVPLQGAIGEATISDGMEANGVMLMGGDFGALEIDPTDKKLDLDAESKEVTSLYNARNVKGEKLADGWILTFDNTGSGGDNFFVESYRDIGGKTYKCATTVPKREQAQAAVAVCKSLKS
jgi:hypothetical protein